MFAVCNASVPLAELELEFLFWPARRQRYKPFFSHSNKFVVHPHECHCILCTLLFMVFHNDLTGEYDFYRILAFVS